MREQLNRTGIVGRKARVRAAVRRVATGALVACLVGATLSVVPDIAIGGSPIDESPELALPTDVEPSVTPDPSPSTTALPTISGDTPREFDPFNVLPQATEDRDPLPSTGVLDTPAANPDPAQEPAPTEPVAPASDEPIVMPQPDPEPEADPIGVPEPDTPAEPVVFDGPGIDPGSYELRVEDVLPDAETEDVELLEIAAPADAGIDSVTVDVIDLAAIFADDEPAPAEGATPEDPAPAEDPGLSDDGAVADSPAGEVGPSPDGDEPSAPDDPMTGEDLDGEPPTDEEADREGDSPEDAASGESAEQDVEGGASVSPSPEPADPVVDELEGLSLGLATEIDDPPGPVEDGVVESPPIANALLAFALSAEEAAQVDVAIDVTELSFESAGETAERLRLVEFPTCALTDPTNPRCAYGAPVDGATVDAGTLVLESELDVERQPQEGELTLSSGGGSIFALMSATGSEAGNYGATPIAANGTWAHGGQAGDFTYSYPIPSPVGIAGPTPQFSLNYSSGAVDAMTTETNNQPGPIGIGWSLGGLGYIERTYQSCAIDGTDDLHAGDVGKNVDEELCWIGNNATIVLNGVTSRLIPLNATGPNGSGATDWVLENDPGWTVTRHSDGSGGPDEENRWGEYWVITDLSGTQYTFGQSLSASLNVPVLSNHDGEPCWGDENENASGASRWCSMPWRWNLERIVDLNDNRVDFTWNDIENKYNKVGLYPTWYDRDAELVNVRYGRNDVAFGGPQHHTAINFYYEDRCFTDCGNDANWLDTPRDLVCDNSDPCTASSPAFFSTVRMDMIETFRRHGDTSSWRKEFKIMFDQRFSSSGKLWIDRIRRTGWGGSSGGHTHAPSVDFYGTLLDNRTAPGGYQMLLPRINKVINELDLQTTVTYGQPVHSGDASECRNDHFGHVPGSGASPTVTWGNNRSYCFPAWYQGVPIVFNKFVVTRIVDTPLVGAAPGPTVSAIATDYTYDRPAWRRSSPLFGTGYELHNDFTGHSEVNVRVGGSDQGSTTTYYHRGMAGSDATYDTNIGPSDDRQTDHEWLRGRVREVAVLNGSGGIHTRSQHAYAETPNSAYAQDSYTYSWGDPPAVPTRTTTLEQRMVREVDTVFIEAYHGNRKTRSVTQYTVHGAPSDRNDYGDVAFTSDNTCTRRNYNFNAAANLLVQRNVQVQQGNSCSGGATLERTVSYYDGLGYTATPTKGNLSTQRDYASGSEWIQRGFGRDAYGRVILTNIAGQANSAITTSFDPPTGVPTEIETTYPDGTTTAQGFYVQHNALKLDRNPGGTATVVRYDTDGLGRRTGVWPGGRAIGSTTTPHVGFEYTITGAEISVTTNTLINDGPTTNKSDDVISTSVDYYDSFGRLREHQTPSPNPSLRIVTATIYDHRGVVIGQTQPYDDGGGVDGGLDNRQFGSIPIMTLHYYDSLNRPIRVEERATNSLVAQTTIVYSGDRVTTSDQVGDVTWQETNALGQLDRSFDGAGTTSYTYTGIGLLATVTAPGGAVTTIGYDWLGRKTIHSDPDSGTWNYAYDGRGRLQYEWTPDRQLLHEYDDLDRPKRVCTSTAAGSGGCGTELRSWTYHTGGHGKGLLKHAISRVDGQQYRRSYAYNVFRQPVSEEVVIPSAANFGATSFVTVYAYDATGAHLSTTYPAVGDLAAETIDYTVDGDGRFLTATSSAFDYISETTYLWNGNPWKTTLGSSTSAPSTSILRTYDPTTNRVSRIYSYGTHLDLNYSYYADGNIEKVYDAKINQSEAYWYDAADRLDVARTFSGNTTSGPTDWSHGGFNQRWDYTASGAIDEFRDGSSTTTYSYSGQRNAVASMSGPGGTESFLYNDEGSRERWTTSAGVTNYTYYATGEMKSQANLGSSGPHVDGVTTYVYDASGQRLIARNGDGSATLWLGDQRIEDDGNGNLAGFRHVASPFGPGAVRSAAGVSLVLTDHLGSTRVTISPGGAVTDHRFDPFGLERTATLDGLVTDRGYTGQVRDTARLAYYNARYYDPGIGQFTQADTIVPDPTAGIDYNRYAYVRNNPIKYNDPTGHCSVISGDLWCSGVNHGKDGSGTAAYHPEFDSRYHVSQFNHNPEFTGVHEYGASGGYDIFVRRSLVEFNGGPIEWNDRPGYLKLQYCALICLSVAITEDGALEVSVGDVGLSVSVTAGRSTFDPCDSDAPPVQVGGSATVLPFVVVEGSVGLRENGEFDSDYLSAGGGVGAQFSAGPQKTWTFGGGC